MDYESACPPSPGHIHHGGGDQRDHMATLEEQLLRYSENAENEGEDEYLEEKMLQVYSLERLCHTHTYTHALTQAELPCDVELLCSALSPHSLKHTHTLGGHGDAG